MPWPSYGNAYAGIPGPSPGVALETYWHNGTSWVLSPYYAHRDGAWRLVNMYRLPAGLDPVPPDDPTTTVIALTDLLVGGETLGTSNDFVNIGRCLQRAGLRTGPALGITTEYITVDFEGQEYFVEDPMGFTGIKVGIGFPNRKTIIDGNVSNPAVKGGLKQVTYDGTNPARWTGTSTNSPLPGTDGSGATGKYRNRYLFQFIDCSHWTFQNFKFTGSNTTGPFTSNFSYDVNREAQHVFWLIGGRDFRFIDCDIAQTFGDVIFMNPYRGPGMTKSNERYTGNVEALGGTWRKIGRIYITMNQTRAPDAIVDGGFWHNPGDGTGPLDGGVNSLPQANSAPSISGTNYGVWWHGNAAHPFLAQGCKRSRVDVENMNSYAHCQDVRIGADTESTAAIDRENFRFTGQGGNLITSVNRWGLISRMTISRIHDSSDGGMAFRVFGSGDLLGYGRGTTIAASMHLVPSVPVPSTIATNCTAGSLTAAGWPTTGGYFQTGIGVLASTPIVIKYTGLSGLNFTGCTYWSGETASRPFISGGQVLQRYYVPERPRYTSDRITLIDCVFDGTNTSILQLHRVSNATIQRNRANYRLANAPNEIQLDPADNPGLDLGTGPAPWGSNDFRGV